MYKTYPIFYGEEEIKQLDGSLFQKMIYYKKESMERDYNLLCALVPEMNDFTYVQFSTALLMIGSRVFGLKLKGVQTLGFVPYAEMFNHKRPKTTKWYFCDNRQGFVIEATKDLKRGNQVYISYGKKCNSKMLMFYGFVNLTNHDANEVSLKATTKSLDQSHDIRENIKIVMNLKQCKRKLMTIFRVNSSLKSDNMIKFLSYMRFLAC